MSRKICQISDNIIALLAKQVSHELSNFVLYTKFANYFSLEGIVDLEEYYKKRAEEEKHHHDWIVTYLCNADAKVSYPAMGEKEESKEISSVIEPFVLTVEREILTTNMLYMIYEAAVAEKDFMTASWLYEKLIKEQIEEESVSRMARTIMETDGDIFVKANKVTELLN